MAPMLAFRYGYVALAWPSALGRFRPADCAADNARVAGCALRSEGLRSTAACAEDAEPSDGLLHAVPAALPCEARPGFVCHSLSRLLASLSARFLEVRATRTCTRHASSSLSAAGSVSHRRISSVFFASAASYSANAARRFSSKAPTPMQRSQNPWSLADQIGSHDFVSRCEGTHPACSRLRTTKLYHHCTRRSCRHTSYTEC